MDTTNFEMIDLDDFPDSWDSNSKNVLLENRVEHVTNNQDPDDNIPGLDMAAAGEWIYPTNYPIRDYQKNIVTKALFNNTLVSLPTGLGKTFIAAVVMYNFNRWYPHHKIVFMAHSKPLVAQQLEACCQIMGIPPYVTAHLNGNIASHIRKQHWETKSIFFLTPQVFNNDLTRGLVSPESIRCVVVDEAHKALGNQAFCQVVRSLQPFNKSFRVLALSATPGDDIATVKSVVENLLISHLDLRTEEDADIQKYLHVKKVEAVVVSLDSKIIEYKSRLQRVAEKYLQQLALMKAISGSFGSLTSFSLVLKQKQFVSNPSVGAEQRGLVLSNFSIAISLFKAIEELVVHGLRSFHNKLLVLKSGEGAKNNVHHRLAKDLEFLSLLQAVEDYIGQDKDVAFDPDISMARLQDELDAQTIGGPAPVVYSHPKFVMLEQIITQHFDEYKEKNDTETKVIVFCKSRPCTGEICNFLNRFRPLVKPMVLIGQSSATGGSTSRGLKQSAQLEVMRKFRAGLYNTLVATCVGEEGLDVGEVDLIVNFDSSRNSNTQVQRSGRTGRKRDGRVVNLVTEGKEYQDYNLSLAKSKTITKKLSKGVQNLPLYKDSPRLLPKHIKPICQEMFLKPTELSAKKSKAEKTVIKSSEKKKKQSKRGKKSDEINASQSTKYDIRYAMNKARHKPKFTFSEDDTSDSLFESVGAVELFKGQIKKPKIQTEILENSAEGFAEIIEEQNQHLQLFSSILAKPLDLKACDILDTLSFDELINLVSNNVEKIGLNGACASTKFVFNDDPDETLCEYQEMSALSSYVLEKNSTIHAEDNEEIIFTPEVENNPIKNTTMLTLTQALAQINNTKPEGINLTPEIQEVTKNFNEHSLIKSEPVNLDQSLSPSLAYTCTARNKSDSRVKKSLTFQDTPPATFELIDLESDEDLFANAEKEQEIRRSQQIKKAENSVSSQPKTAIVRPIGFESISSSLFDDSQWLSTDDKPKNTSFFYQKKPTPSTKQKTLLSFVTKNATPKPNETNFDCVPDDLNALFESSPFKMDTPISKKQPLKQSTPIMRTIPESDDELSDGALEAIQAVEKYEKQSETNQPINKTDQAVFNLWGSDDDDDFVVTKPPPEIKTKNKKRKRRKRGNMFIEQEAEISGSQNETSDDEDTSGLDELDSSFLDERIAPTQAPDVDMTAKYLTTTRSPKGILGRFKIPHPVKCDFEVFSQLDVNDDDYVHDSFCVANDTEDINPVLSQLEVVEKILEKKKKRKRGESSSPTGKKKRRRIIVNESSSDDEIQIIDSTMHKNSKNLHPESKPSFNPSVPPFVLIGSRQIASAPEITIALRAKFQFRVDVRSCPGADFIVSWRMGINRIILSDFCNGSPAVKTSIKESTSRLCELFIKPVIVVEDDKMKSAPRTVGCHRDMWARHSAKRLAKFYHEEVPVMFSKNKDETADIIARLTKSECEKGNGVVTDWNEFSTELESRIKFYTSLPGVNIALALKLCRKFSTLSSFLSSCDTVTNIIRIMNLPESVAKNIYNAII